MKQNYSLDIITSLFHQYFPEKEIIQYSLCNGGAENSNFLIETENEEFILKVFENAKNEMDIVESEVAIMTDVYEMGAHVPQVFDCKNNLKKITHGPGGKPVILMQFIKGKIDRNICLKKEALYQTGLHIAHLHDLFKIITGKYDIPKTHKFDFKYIIGNSDLRKIHHPILDDQFLEKVWSDIDDIADVFHSLDQQLIHNDLNSGNIVFQEDFNPFFIDFSDIVISSRIQDIAISLVSFCFTRHWYPEGVEYYFSGYQKVFTLSDNEKNCLFACVEIRILNIIFIPFLDTGLGEADDFWEHSAQYFGYLKRFHEFGKENFMKFII